MGSGHPWSRRASSRSRGLGALLGAFQALQPLLSRPPPRGWRLPASPGQSRAGGYGLWWPRELKRTRAPRVFSVGQGTATCFPQQPGCAGRDGTRLSTRARPSPATPCLPWSAGFPGQCPRSPSRGPASRGGNAEAGTCHVPLVCWSWGLGAESRAGVRLLERGVGSSICHRRGTARARRPGRTWAAAAQQGKAAPRGNRRYRKVARGLLRHWSFVGLGENTWPPNSVRECSPLPNPEFTFLTEMFLPPPRTLTILRTT